MKSTQATTARRCMAGSLLTALMVGGLAGCSLETAEATRVNEPATLEDVGGGVSRITLSAQGAERLGVATAPVEKADGGGLTVPYSALLYDATGKTWVYVTPEPLVFVRQPVTVDRVDGEAVKLTSGPAVGTPVVIVGASELLGAELDVEE
ncbi:hypothetical protein [Cryobacterium tepidiphilum]|nr:hypothetical protein [Cryobacterium tepidiphilum]